MTGPSSVRPGGTKRPIKSSNCTRNLQKANDVYVTTFHEGIGEVGHK